METHIQPLFHANVTYSRKVGVYRASFLMGRCLAPSSTIREAGIKGTEPDPDFGKARLFSNSWQVISRAEEKWMKRNREGK